MTGIPAAGGEKWPPGVTHRGQLYLSGVGGAGPTLQAQAGSAWQEVAARLAAGGFTTAEVIRVVEYISDGVAESANVVADARQAALGTAAPSVAVVIVPGFMQPESLVELEVVASHDADPAEVPGARSADGVVYLDSILPVDAAGRIAGDGLVQQVSRVFENARTLLERLGLGPRDIVVTVDHTTPATRRDYRYTGAIRREHLGPVYPGAAGILQDRLSVPGALVSLDVVASRHPLRTINPGWARYEKLTYSPAVEAGPMLFMSGQGALDPATEQALFPGDLRAQVEYTYQNVVKVLEAAGRGPGDLLQVVEYLTPEAMDRRGEVDAVRGAVLGDHGVATTRVACAGLLRPEFLIEVIPLATAR